MSFEIKNRRDLSLVPVHIFRDPDLPLELKGVAAVMLCLEGSRFTTRELAQALDVSEALTKAYVLELQYAGYANIFELSENGEAVD